MSKTKNPYKRMKEIDELLEPLELKEKAYKKIGWKKKPKDLDEIEREIFFLAIERNIIERTVSWFEKGGSPKAQNRK